MRIRKISIRGLLVDPIAISQNKRHKNCMVDSKRIITVFRSISTKVTGCVNFYCMSS